MLVCRWDSEEDRSVAIKTIDLEETEDDIEEIQQEIATLCSCDSPYITKHIQSFVVKSHLWIIMEFLDGGSILDLIKIRPLEESMAAVAARGVLCALGRVVVPVRFA